MKQILVLGAGRSAAYLIHRLLELAAAEDWFVIVGDLDPALASKRVANHPRGSSVRFDVNDAKLRATLFEKADVVVNMLSSAFQHLVAWDCVNHGRHMLSVSYRDADVRELELDAQHAGVLLLCELGLDPGIDHMSSMSVIEGLDREGGRITGFRSYGSGVPAPDGPQNPLRYVITWNPRNVVMSSEHGAQYMDEGKIKCVPFHHVFHHTWPVEVDGVGMMEAYPNRDSMSYMKTFGLEHARTMIRGTLRYPGWSETWAQIVRLGLPNEQLRIPDLADRTYRQVVEMFLPLNVTGAEIEQRTARFLQISPTGSIMENLRWLGLFSDERIGCESDTTAAMMTHLLKKKLPLEPDQQDLVVILHQLDVEYPGQDRPAERVTSSLVEKGEAGGFTAMARTVGLPVAIVVRLLLRGELSLAGSHIPTHPTIYGPVLRELAGEGLAFTERVETLERPAADPTSAAD